MKNKLSKFIALILVFTLVFTSNILVNKVSAVDQVSVKTSELKKGNIEGTYILEENDKIKVVISEDEDYRYITTFNKLTQVSDTKFYSQKTGEEISTEDMMKYYKENMDYSLFMMRLKSIN